MHRSGRPTVIALIAGLVLSSVGLATTVTATDYPYFACASGSGHLSSPSTERTIAQGQSAVFTIDIERIGCDDPITFSLAAYTPPGAVITFSENPTTAASITLTVTTSKAWPNITPVGSYGPDIHLSTGHNDTNLNYIGFALTVTASSVPISKTPTPGLAVGTIGTSTANVKTSWGAVDPDGIRSYTVQRQKNGGSWTTVALPSKTQTSISQALSFGSKYRYRVRATDKLGHVGAFTYGKIFAIKLVQQTSSAITSPWVFKTLHSSSASGGSLEYQPYSGSDFMYTYHAAGVAWVSVTGPTRSNSLEMFLDNVHVKSNYSLKASATHYRRIVYAKNSGVNATHTLYVQNLGQIGHCRLDIDAFVLLTYY